MRSDDTTASRFPLSWPVGWSRTRSQNRQRAPFRRAKRQLSVSDGIDRLIGELDRLGATREVLSTNVELRLDGLPRSNQPEPSDPGAAVYFKLSGKDRCLACDRWNRVADNIASIAQHIDALRRIERYGVGTIEQAFTGYTALPAQAGPNGIGPWRLILGFDADAIVTADRIKTAHRHLALALHPDTAVGDSESMIRLNLARDAALAEVSA